MEIYCHVTSHNVIFYEIHSHIIFAEYLIFFREIAYLLAIIVKHDIAKSKFDPFGANLRKFYLFGIKVDIFDYINHLRPLHRMAQKDFYRGLKFANFDP